MKKIALFITLCLFANMVGMTQWTLKGLEIDGETMGEECGTSVSINSDGSVIAVGAPLNNDSGIAAGQVQVYEWDGTDWSQKGIDIDGESMGDQSGTAVSLSSDGNLLAIGSPFNDGAGTDAGHVRIYEWDGTSWIQKGLDINGESGGNQSGWSVSLSSDGSTVVIGAPLNGDGGGGSGHARVYEWDGSDWSQKGIDIDGEAASDRCGWSVSTSSNGDIIAIGAHFNSDGGSLSGHVRIFEWISDEWVQMGIAINGESSLDQSGWSISLDEDGNTVAIGARLNNAGGIDAGHVRIYEWDGSDWSQKGIDIDGENINDQSGSSVSLNASGNRVAIGAHFNDEGATNAGQVKVYEWTGLEWIQVETNINGEGMNDESGTSVALSMDGGTVIVGAPFNDGAGVDAGHLRVYEPLCGVVPDETILSAITICDGDSVLIFDQYQSMPGFYNDTLISMLGCDSIDVQELIINTVELEITLSGANFVATAEGVGVEYQWIDCNDNTIILDEINQSFTPLENGNYACIVNDNGCIDTTDCIMIADVGIKTLDDNSKLLIYPNPAKGQFNIILEKGELNQVDIYNVLGEIVYSQILNETNLVEINQLEKGIYQLAISTSIGLIRRKVIIN